MNSLRAAAWWLRKNEETCKCAMVGAVGKDDAASVLEEECRKEGIATEFLSLEGHTARCAILVYNHTRTMVTDLGAAAKIRLGTPAAIEKHVGPLLEAGSSIVFCTAYYVNADPDGGRCLVSERRERYDLAISLAAAWAAGLPIVAEVLRGCKMVFGTLEEARAFATANGGASEDDDAVARFVQAWPGQEDRWAIISDGPGDVRFASSAGVRKFPVPSIESSSIVDDNGAGDAFAGTFLACHALGKSLPEAVAAAMATARVVLQNVGCQFEEKDDEGDKRIKCAKYE